MSLPLPEPRRAANTMFCVRCGLPYAPHQTGKCECGSTTFQGQALAGEPPPQYTADQLREYGRAVAEECAKLIESRMMHAGTLGRVLELRDAAAAIRARFCKD